MRAALAALALVLVGCAHAAGVRYAFRPCNAAFQDTVAACFYEAGAPWAAFSYDFYADSGMVEKQWKAQYESCMFRRGLQSARRPGHVATQAALQRRRRMAVARRSAQGPLDVGEDGRHGGPELLRRSV
jgi:hypothetical protein